MKENIQKDVITEINDIEKSLHKYLFEISTITNITSKFKIPIELCITFI